MNNNGLVSIILPIYNQEKYLDISIPAVMRQQYHNIEIILVNDGSIDNSKKIIEKYKKQDNRIVVIEKENGGLVDATIAGVQVAKGEFICFLDPDDTIGEDFIQNFIDRIENCDAIAFGFYKNNCGKIDPVVLQSNCIYEGEELVQCRRELFIKENGYRSENKVYISRWNKMYRTRIIAKFIDRFAEYKDVSLGEDSIFTYLLISNCNKIRAISAANSYYYNIGNQSSMMKSGAIDAHIRKAHTAFDTISKIADELKDDDRQAYALFYFLVETLFQRVISDGKQFQELYTSLQNDTIYKGALAVCRKINGKIGEYDILLREMGLPPKLYRRLFVFSKALKKSLRSLKWEAKGILLFFDDLKKRGFHKAIYLSRFRKDRFNAFKDLQLQLPVLEERITPILSECKEMQTDFSLCPIERNVFVFWWDGFEKAPLLVQRCLESVRSAHKDCTVIPISKDNYQEYTDIHPIILRDYNAGKISVQTFSDILRFNLLKNNGGVWIDATIYFEREYNLIDKLKDKAIESVCFSTSTEFLKYKNEVCSWSGYFFASRKNSVFTQAMDTIFREYYLKYHTYSIYFFIDAALMICKLNGIDNAALSKIHTNDADMTLLSKLLNQHYDPMYRKNIARIPQKLAWNYKSNGQADSVYAVIIENGDSRCLEK